MSGKRFWAVLIKQSLAGLIVVFLIGILFDYLSNEPDGRSPLTAGAVACALYIVASLIIGLIGTLSKALYLWLFTGDDMVDTILDEMRGLQLPPPRSDQHKNYDYLNQLVNDDEARTIDRVRAASFTGAYNVLMGQGLFRALSLRKALDAAALRYYQEAPQRI
jgi:hypothetical protein